MRSINFAEWILALVTTRDRARSTVGDLTEGAAARSVVSFWSGVLRTAAALLWRGVAEQPARAIGRAFVGLVAYIGIDWVCTALGGVAFFFAAMASGHPLQLDSIGCKLWFNLPVLASSLLVGRMLARWAPRRELATCVVYAIFASIYNLDPRLGANGALSSLLCVVIVLAGATWGRRRRLLTVD
jgi:hypothetical protein